MKKELVTNELEQAAGGLEVSGYEFERGDKYREKTAASITFTLSRLIPKIQPSGFVAAVVNFGKGSAIEAGVQAVSLFGREYLGVDIDGMAQVLTIVRR